MYIDNICEGMQIREKWQFFHIRNLAWLTFMKEACIFTIAELCSKNTLINWEINSELFNRIFTLPKGLKLWKIYGIKPDT